MVSNIRAFNEYTLSILNLLHKYFPCSTRIDMETMIGETPLRPDFPFKTLYGISGALIYEGPDLGWVADKESRAQIWRDFDWSACQARVEAILGRDLDENELQVFLSSGTRPYTPAELEEIESWRQQVSEWKETAGGLAEQKEIFLSTLKFLLNEGYIRYEAIPENERIEINPPDVLVDRALGRLNFTLTSKGFVQLNKPIAFGSDTGTTLFTRIRSYVADKTVDAFGGAAAGSLVALFLRG